MRKSVNLIRAIELTVPVSLADVADDVANWDDIAEIVEFISTYVNDDEVAAAVCRKLTAVWSLDTTNEGEIK